MQPDAEWLETDGLGGYAMGTALGLRTRRYHGLLVHASTPPTGRMMLINGLELELETEAGRFALSTQRYAPDVLHPRGFDLLTDFRVDPWPTWTYALPNGDRYRLALFQRRGQAATYLALRRLSGRGRAELRLRPLLSFRIDHGLHHENPNFRMEAEAVRHGVVFSPYPGVPSLTILSNGQYQADPLWFRRFRYSAETERGLDDQEDLASPGVLRFDLAEEARLRCSAGRADPTEFLEGFEEARREEAARRRRLGAVGVAAEAFLVRRDQGWSIVAGYPWFTDWGRDTFIAMRGLLADQPERRRQLLHTWAKAERNGLLPNRFTDRGEEPEYHSVDAALWFVIACAEAWPEGRPPEVQAVIDRILDRFEAGTELGIGADTDGLLWAGQPGLQLTWMDAKVGEEVVTPRRGKPVEIQCLWINALELGGGRQPLADQARASFLKRFWREDRGELYDVVDVERQRGTVDESVRPNQIFAIGGLPAALLPPAQGRRVLAAVERQLWIPGALRTLAPDDPRYQGRYQGGPGTRDRAYHQGTAWPWLLGPFVEAHLRLYGDRAEAERRLGPLTAHLRGPGFGHLPELKEGSAPYPARGCPAQAWSLGEWIRLTRMLALRT